jgi:hypothetical protein
VLLCGGSRRALVISEALQVILFLFRVFDDVVRFMGLRSRFVADIQVSFVCYCFINTRIRVLV